jgi:putative peptidoglycan lipid II flippase
VGIAIGTVLLPDLSRPPCMSPARRRRDSFNRGAEFALALTIPAAVALVVMALPLTTVLFQRGAFGADDAANTALALAAYGIGLPAFVLHKVLQPLFYAREDTRRPFRYALVSMVVNAAFAVGLMPVMGFMAAALATTVAGWVMVWQLWAGSRPMGEAARPDDRFRRRLPRILVASAVMGVVLWAGEVALGPALGQPGLRYLALGALVLMGIASYFGTGALVGAFRLAEFRSLLRRQR